MNLEIERLIERAAQEARDEERALMECGHPMACLPFIPLGSGASARCLACAREARAVEEAVAAERAKFSASLESYVRAGVSGALAEAEARVRRECAAIVRKHGDHDGGTLCESIADAIERGERSGEGE